MALPSQELREPRGKRLLRPRAPAPTGPTTSLEVAQLGTSDDSQSVSAAGLPFLTAVSAGRESDKGENGSDTSSLRTGEDREKWRWVYESGLESKAGWRRAPHNAHALGKRRLHPTHPPGSGCSQRRAGCKGGLQAQLPAGGPGPQGHGLTLVPKQTPLWPLGVPRWYPEAGVSQGQGASSPSPPCSAPYSFLTPQQAQVPAPLHWGGT